MSMTIPDMVEVLRGANEGKRIEMRPRGDSGAKWISVHPWDAAWNFQYTDYRVKPEAREFWIVKRDSGPYSGVYESRNDAMHYIKGSSRSQIIHVKEVLE